MLFRIEDSENEDGIHREYSMFALSDYNDNVISEGIWNCYHRNRRD